MPTNTTLDELTDDALLAEVTRAAEDERRSTAHLIALLGELDARRLYLGVGCSSLFTYCTQVLHLSEHAAYNRIETARAGRCFPIIFELLRNGSVTLTTIRLLRPHLTVENHAAVLASVGHRSRREVEELIARLHPRPPIPPSVRKLPTRKPAATAAPPDPGAASLLEQPGPAAGVCSDAGQNQTYVPAAPVPRPSAVKPLAPERYQVQFTVSAETHAKLRQAQQLLRHQIPSGDPAAIFDRALTMLLEHLQRTKCGASERPRQASPPHPRSRRIPAAVRREVWKRDGGRCAFVGTTGRRCTETGMLEFHHVTPYAAGGEATGENIQLRCRAHNLYESELFFGVDGTDAVRERPVPFHAPNSFRNEFMTPIGPRVQRGRESITTAT